MWIVTNTSEQFMAENRNIENWIIFQTADTTNISKSRAVIRGFRHTSEKKNWGGTRERRKHCVCGPVHRPVWCRPWWLCQAARHQRVDRAVSPPTLQAGRLSKAQVPTGLQARPAWSAAPRSSWHLSSGSQTPVGSPQERPRNWRACPPTCSHLVWHCAPLQEQERSWESHTSPLTDWCLEFGTLPPVNTQNRAEHLQRSRQGSGHSGRLCLWRNEEDGEEVRGTVTLLLCVLFNSCHMSHSITHQACTTQIWHSSNSWNKVKRDTL